VRVSAPIPPNSQTSVYMKLGTAFVVFAVARGGGATTPTVHVCVWGVWGATSEGRRPR